MVGPAETRIRPVRPPRGAALLPLLCACANAPRAVPAANKPDEPQLLFPFPDYEDYFEGGGNLRGEGGFAIDVAVRADSDQDGQNDRSLEVVIAGRLVTREASSGALTAIPLDGRSPSLLATSVPPGTVIAGDDRAIYFATPDGALWETPGRQLGICAGNPRYLFVDETHVYAFAHSQLFPYDVGMLVCALARAGGPVRTLAELPARDAVAPDQRPVQDADAFYFAHAERSVYRLAKHTGALSRIAYAEPRFAGAGIEVALVDGGFLYWKANPQLVRLPVTGGTPVVVTVNLPILFWDVCTFRVVGDQIYFHAGERLYAAPRAGGKWVQQAWAHGPLRDVFEHARRLYVLSDQMLARVDPAVHPERRIAVVADDTIVALGARGDKLYYTLAGHTPRTARRTASRARFWSIPKGGGHAALVLKAYDLDAAPVIDDDSIYLLDARGAVLRASIKGDASIPLVPPARRGDAVPTVDLLPRALAVDADHVYWLDRARGAVMRVPKKGGAPTAVAQALPAPIELAVGDGFAVVETSGNNHWQLLGVPIAPPGPTQRLAAAEERMPFTVAGREIRGGAGVRADLGRRASPPSPVKPVRP